jgi:hypothetical protein
MISKFLEVNQKDYFSFLGIITDQPSKLEMGLSEFESESLAPKAKRMDQATLQAPHTR